ncbi:MAG: alpha-L-rhamnosidase, partial [Spirochaetaceae bacterium]
MASPATLTALTVEHLANALGIDVRVPRFSWKLVDPRPGASQAGYQIQVATDERFTGSSIVWDSGQVASSSSVLVPYRASGDARPIESCTRYFFRVCIRDAGDEWTGWSDTDWFETAFLDAEWSGQWVSGSEWSDQDDQDASKPGGGHPAPYLRREFELSGTPRSGRLYAAARGLMELSLNGSRIGDAVLSPGWTDYNSRCQYVTYDVTGLLQPGENAIDAILGDGWYSGRIAWVQGNKLIGTDTGRDQRQFGSIPQLLCELHVDLEDGSQVVIASDGEWTWTTGPVLKSDIYDGESYDARIVPTGWKP